MEIKQIPLEERQRNIHEAIVDISRCDSPSNLNGVLIGALFSWRQKMRTSYMDKYPYRDDIYTALLYIKYPDSDNGKEIIKKLKKQCGYEIEQTLQSLGGWLMEQHENNLLNIFLLSKIKEFV